MERIIVTEEIASIFNRTCVPVFILDANIDCINFELMTLREMLRMYHNWINDYYASVWILERQFTVEEKKELGLYYKKYDREE